MYAPSLHNHVDVVLQPGYTPPSGSAVDAELTSTGIFLWRASSYNHVDAVLQPGYTPPSGTAVDATLTRPMVGLATLYPDGIDSEAFGTPAVRNHVAYLLPGGIPPASNPSAPTVILREQHVFPAGFYSGNFPTSHYVAHYVQYSPQNGWDNARYGTPSVAHAIREVAPPYILSLVFGAAAVRHKIGIEPTGWESSTFPSTHEVVINTRRLYGDGWVSSHVGEPSIRNQFANVNPPGWTEEDVGFPIVELRDRYVYPLSFYGTDDPPNFLGTPSVVNVIRELRPQGHQSSRFGISTLVYNNAVPIQPSGWESTEWGADTFIAYRDRTVTPLGWDSLITTGYAAVYNGARVIAPASITPGSVGSPSLLNLNREIKQHSGPTGEVFGTASIAPAVRTIFPAVFNDVPAGIPDVRFNPYPISPVGIEPPQFGLADVIERFNYIRPMSTNVHSVPWVGEPFIYNVNRVVRVTPSDQSSYGIPRVELFTRIVTTAGVDTSVFGSATITYRTRTIQAGTISVPGFPNTHVVRNDLPDPPSTQRVYPTSIYIGPPAAPGIVSEPVVSVRAIYPTGIAPGIFGGTTVRRNSIEPDGIGTLEQFGIPTMIAPQYFYPTMIPDTEEGGDSDRVEFQSQPALSPHTIYAPSSDQATDQARRNHPPNNPHVIDMFLGPKIGIPTISNYYRAIYPLGSEHSVFGTAEVTLRRRYVYPRTFIATRFGLPVIPFTPQTVTLDSYGFDSSVFGDPTVTPPPYVGPHYITPTSINTGAVGAHDVQLSIRTIYPPSITSDIWGLPLVGYPRVFPMSGFVATLWGTARVEHKIRTVYPQGHDSFTSGPDLEHFADRMRVTGRNELRSVPSIPSSNAFGIPHVALSLRTIIAWGIPPRAFGTPRLSQRIYPLGWDSAEYGDIDEWVAGMIKAHGDDMSAVGTPRLLHPLYVSGILSDEYGTPNVARGIRPTGIAPPTFDGPVLTDVYGCNNRYIVPLPILSQSVVSVPEVA